jgi:hypothetical protein
MLDRMSDVDVEHLLAEGGPGAINQGVAITSGTRYILAGFLRYRPAATNPGRLL